MKTKVNAANNTKKPTNARSLDHLFEKFESITLTSETAPNLRVRKRFGIVHGEATLTGNPHEKPKILDRLRRKKKSVENNNIFKKVIEDYNIQKIDFLKTDCESGEYDIFTLENLFWIKNNVKKIAGEWHLGDAWMKEKFQVFRDVYLRVFPNFKVLSFNGVDITEHIWTPEFISYYSEIMIYIDNRD